MKMFKRAAGVAVFVGTMTVSGYSAVSVTDYLSPSTKNLVTCTFSASIDGEMVAHLTGRPFGAWERLAVPADDQVRHADDGSFAFGLARVAGDQIRDAGDEAEGSSGGVSPASIAGAGFHCAEGPSTANDGAAGASAPEASSWIMMIVGFGCLGFAAFHRPAKPKAPALI
jgi:hypothetical protein